ncbi:MAG: hypothetical protein IIY06_12625 [Proteobacteria bacterium]|nr:hypothetical protein [Pseudomonadota bacterium]
MNKNHVASLKSLRSLATAIGAAALLIPSLALAEQPEIDCMSLSDSDQQAFYELSGQAQESAGNGDLDSALSDGIKAMSMCTTDAYTEYTLARIYQMRSNCPAALYHLERLQSRIAAIKAEDKSLAKAITNYYGEANNECGNAVSLEITCATPDTKIQLNGAIDTPVACPVYSKIMPGAYSLTATREKFFPFKDTITVSQEPVVYTVPALQDSEDFGNVRIKCPRGAMKFILTDPKGIVNEYACPWEGQLPSGNYKVKLGGSEGGAEADLVVTKSAQIEHVIPSEVRANCSATVRDSANGGFAALLLGILGAFGLASVRRKREN